MNHLQDCLHENNLRNYLPEIEVDKLKLEYEIEIAKLKMIGGIKSDKNWYR